MSEHTAEPVEIDGQWYVRYRTPGQERLIEAGPYRGYAEHVAAALAAYPPMPDPG